MAMTGGGERHDYGSTGAGGADESTSLRGVVQGNVEEGGMAGSSQVPEWQADGFLNQRASAQLQGDKRRTRDSIFAASIALQAESQETRKKVSSAASNIIIQIVAFCLVAIFSGFQPFFIRKLNASSKFIGPTPFIVDYALSILVGNIVAFAIQGKAGLVACWDLWSIIRFSPSLILASAAEALQMFIFRYMDGTSWRILKQLKLPLTAVGVRFILGRKGMNCTQWFLIACVTCGVVGYCLQSSKGGGTNLQAMGIVLGLASLCSTVLAAILGDHLYKTVQYPLYVQMPQGRVDSMVCVAVMVLITCYQENLWHLFLFGGWTWQCWVLSIWLCVKDWTGAFVLKHLDSVWKSLAGVCALVISFVLDVSMGTRGIDVIAIAFMLCVVINILAFAVSKREAGGGKKKDAK